MILVLKLDKFDNVFVDQVITLGIDVVDWSAADADDTSNKLFVDHVTRAGVGRRKHTADETNHVTEGKLNHVRKIFEGTEWTVCRVDVPFGTGNEMGKSGIVANEHKVLLLGREEMIRISLLVISPGSKHMIPNGHEQCIVSTEEGVVAKVEFRRVKQVLEWRVFGSEDRMTVLDVHVTICVDKVEQNKVGSDNCPMHLPIK